MGFTVAEKKKITAEYAPRYRKAKKTEKSKLLDEYLALTGSKSQKYAIFKLNRAGKTQLRVIGGETVNIHLVDKARKNGSTSPIMTKQWQKCCLCCGKVSTGSAVGPKVRNSSPRF
jgi:hypothetical protein